MTLKLNGSSSGYTAIDAPAAAGSNTLVLPADNGSNGEFLQTNGSGTLDWAAVTPGLSIETKYLDPGTTNTSNLDYGTSGSLLSTNTKSFQIAIAELGINSSGDYGVQLGYGSTPTYHTGTNYYKGYTVYHYNPGTADGSGNMDNNNYVRLNWNMDSSNNKSSGMIRGQHVNGNVWNIVFDLIFETSEHPICSTGTWWTTALSGALTSVRITTGQTFNSGVLNYTGIVS